MRAGSWLRPSTSLALGLLTTIAIAWGASLQPRAGMVVLPHMTWRERNPAAGEGEGWVRAHHMYKPAWRCTVAQATPALTYRFTDACPLTPEQVVRDWSRPLALPWLSGARPWPGINQGESLYVDAFGWPALALYTRRFESGPSQNATDHLLDLSSLAWFSRRPMDEIRGLPVGIVWTGLLADTAIWSLPWLPLCYAGPLRRAWRLRRNHCPHCNYDLRATPLHCPECGREP